MEWWLWLHLRFFSCCVYFFLLTGSSLAAWLEILQTILMQYCTVHLETHSRLPIHFPWRMESKRKKKKERKNPSGAEFRHISSLYLVFPSHASFIGLYFSCSISPSTPHGIVSSFLRPDAYSWSDCVERCEPWLARIAAACRRVSLLPSVISSIITWQRFSCSVPSKVVCLNCVLVMIFQDQNESAAILKIKESMLEEAKRFEKDTDHPDYFMQ